MSEALWKQVQALSAEGKNPIIEVTPAARIIRAKLAPHRPRKRPEDAPKHYRKEYVMTVPGGEPMRCRRKGCNQRMLKGQAAIVCSPACEKELRWECEVFLSILNGVMNPRDLPQVLRTNQQRKAHLQAAGQWGYEKPKRARSPNGTRKSARAA